MDAQDLNSLVEDPANVPLPLRLGALFALFALIVFMGYKLIIVNTLNELDGVERKESGLKKDFESKQAKAALLPAYKKQLEEMRHSFGTLVRQLPSETEIPGLILDISEKGIFHGLEIDLFQPGAETRKEFYAEKPITLKARGSYAQLAAFVSDISGLSRIVTIDNISLTPSGEKLLAMTATIKTYRYLSIGDEA